MASTPSYIIVSLRKLPKYDCGQIFNLFGFRLELILELSWERSKTIFESLGGPCSVLLVRFWFSLSVTPRVSSNNVVD
jgi:hypothetical protein